MGVLVLLLHLDSDQLVSRYGRKIGKNRAIFCSKSPYSVFRQKLANETRPVRELPSFGRDQNVFNTYYPVLAFPFLVFAVFVRKRVAKFADGLTACFGQIQAFSAKTDGGNRFLVHFYVYFLITCLV